MSAAWQLLLRDVRLAFRQGGAVGLTLAFFVIAVTLFPLGVGPEPALLARIAPGVVWVAALLAALLSLDRLFQADYEDGSLDQLALSSLPLAATVLIKCAAHWLTTGVPLILASPVLALLLQMEAGGYGALVAGMAIGTPALSLIGAVGAALAIGVRRGGVLLSLLVLPLYVPVLIFGVLAVDASLAGLSAAPFLQYLGAMTLLGVIVAPLAAVKALRLALG